MIWHLAGLARVAQFGRGELLQNIFVSFDLDPRDDLTIVGTNCPCGKFGVLQDFTELFECMDRDLLVGFGLEVLVEKISSTCSSLILLEWELQSNDCNPFEILEEKSNIGKEGAYI